jgi:hypothetical protein
MKYVLITPAQNEEAYIEKTLAGNGSVGAGRGTELFTGKNLNSFWEMQQAAQLAGLLARQLSRVVYQGRKQAVDTAAYLSVTFGQPLG